MAFKQSLLKLIKNSGETPLEMLERFKRAHPEYKDEKMSYLGRLDPLASGLVLVAVGEENKNRGDYLHLDKTYECEFVCGFETDTFDVLGVVTKVAEVITPHIVEETKMVLREMLGTQLQEFPPYSSKPVEGKPLWQWAREKRLDEIKLPKKQIDVFSISLLDAREVEKAPLEKRIKTEIAKVKGDFRQEAIKKSWHKALIETPYWEYPLLTLKIECSSGTYVRSLVHEVGKKLGCGATLIRLNRTVVGKYKIEDNSIE